MTLPVTTTALSKGDVNALTPVEASAHREELGALHPTPELLKYYRDRVADFEREREELLAEAYTRPLLSST
jgi:hypothetical protein